MQNFAQVPVFSDVMDKYDYPALTSGTTQNKLIRISTANGGAKAYITFQPDHYFLFCAFACQTNYDSSGGVFASANANGVISQPQTPNNFLVEIQRAASNNYGNVQLCQAEVCSSGQLAGKQNPYPVIYGPEQTVSFQFTDLTGLHLLTQADAAVPLDIQFWMIGYSIACGVNNSNFRRFLEYFPGLQQIY